MSSQVISAYSEESEAAAVSAAIGMAASDYGDESESLHIIVTSVFKAGEGWQASVLVIVEECLDEDADDDNEDSEDDEDEDGEEDDDDGEDDRNEYEQYEEALRSVEDTSGEILFYIFNSNTETEATLASEPPLQKDPRKPFAKAVMKKSGALETCNEVDACETLQKAKKERAKRKELLERLENERLNIPRTQHHLKSFVYISSKDRDIYDALNLDNKTAHIHLIEDGPMWDMIQNFSLDNAFYESTHSSDIQHKAELDKIEQERKLSEDAFSDSDADDFTDDFL